MDLNYLLHRHQISLMRAEAAACIESRHAHQAFANSYAKQIDDFVRPTCPPDHTKWHSHQSVRLCRSEDFSCHVWPARPEGRS